SISIYNDLGQKVFESAANGNVFDYDFCGQKAGVYFIKVETIKGVTSMRVIVQ
ncbi:MAG: T9SS type A sorting domain-containing protein, partial [Muribaculaceae bacterium]|nr:T9SS type A sorting domain-containing protein [Muribaculaceae bacterium]